MKNQNFGIEIELTGITREAAATVAAEYFGTFHKEYVGGSYSTWEAYDQKGRRWKFMYDSSIRAEKKSGRTVVSVSDSAYKCECVSPILQYEDIELLQELIRQLRHKGAIANNSCGIHIHVDAARHNAKTLRNLINLTFQKEDLLYKALAINPSRVDYCKKINAKLLQDLNVKKPATMEKLADIWYGQERNSNRYAHYNSTRYHGINLHATFTKGTVEFRLFNSTTHAGKIKAYVQFCLAVSAQALNQKSARATRTETNNEKYTFRCWMLRLGLIGDEFKTCRLHFLEHLSGNAAWRDPNHR